MSKVFEPEYYKDFSCIGGACRYTCCQGWQITFTRAEYNRLRSARVSPALKETIETGIKRDKKSGDENAYAKMVFDEQQKCPFLDEAGLCRMQLECGPAALSAVCKTFPRAKSELPGYLQRCCSTGCEQILNLMLEKPEGLRFVEREDVHAPALKLQKAIEQTAQEKPAIRYLAQIQALCIAILQNRVCTLDERMILLGLALQDFDKAAEAGEDGVRDWLARRAVFATPEGGQAVKQRLTALPGNPQLSALNSLFLAQSIRAATIDVHFVLLYDAVVEALNVRAGVEEDGQTKLTFSTQQYAQAMENFAQQTQNAQHLLESVMVNYFFERLAPVGEKSAWQHYVTLCYSYSFLRLMAAGYLVNNPGMESYIHALAVGSRRLFHSPTVVERVTKELRETDSDSLAHMAVLVKA